MKTDNLPHYRQGDVLLQRVASLPKGLTKVPRVDGKIIVALGSSNGNPHYFEGKGSEMLRDADGAQSLVLVGKRISGRFQIEERRRNWLVLDCVALGLIAFHKSDVSESKGQPELADVSGRFELLKHAEHTAHAYPDGTYSHVPQRGFNRGEIRRVQD